MRIYFFALAALILGAIAPSFAAWDSPSRGLRALLILVVYPLFVVMAVTHGVRPAGLTWLALAAAALALEMIADTLVPDPHASLFRNLRNAVLLWPITIPAAIEALLIRFGLAPAQPDARLPEPPRGAALVALSDDEMLVAAHEILSAEPQLSAEEKAILVAESFNREIHGGGFLQWFHNSDVGVADTIQSLRDVGAQRTAELLRRAADTIPSSWNAAQSPDERSPALERAESVLGPLSDEFFALEHQEDLTSLIAQFLRQQNLRCPALIDGDRR